MKRSIVIVVIGVALSLLAFGCKKKEEQPVPQAGQTPSMSTPMGGPQGGMAPKVEKQVVVPAEVKGKWSKVILVVQDKVTKKSSEYTIKLGSQFEIPGSGLKVAVGEFLPEFIMSESKITSASNEPKNPAVNVEVFESNKSVFKGWLYSKYPTVHPFEHSKYSLSLKDGIKG